MEYYGTFIHLLALWILDKFGGGVRINLKLGEGVKPTPAVWILIRFLLNRTPYSPMAIKTITAMNGILWNIYTPPCSMDSG